MKLSKLREEVKLTLNLMQTDIDDDAHSELRMHLREVLLLKREVLQQDDEAKPLTEEELKRLVDALEKIADLKLPSTDGVTDSGIAQDRWRKFLEAQGIAESAIARYRKKPVTHDAEPLIADELKAGGWWCEDVSEECRLALVDKGVYVVSPCWSVDNRAKYAYKSGCGLSVIRTSLRVDELKQIHRVGNDFYWAEL